MVDVRLRAERAEAQVAALRSTLEIARDTLAATVAYDEAAIVDLGKMFGEGEFLSEDTKGFLAKNKAALATIETTLKQEATP